MALVFSGKKMREVRVARKMTQENLAEKLHTRTTNISKWENDRSSPNGVNMVLLLRALECELEEVVNRVP